MEDKIIDIIAEVCGDDTIKDNIDIDLMETDLLDSLAFLNLISKLEDEFDIELQPTQIPPNTWKSVSAIIELVKNKIK